MHCTKCKSYDTSFNNLMRLSIINDQSIVQSRRSITQVFAINKLTVVPRRYGGIIAEAVAATRTHGHLSPAHGDEEQKP